LAVTEVVWAGMVTVVGEDDVVEHALLGLQVQLENA
jgi:hypothetical protein